ncbi:glycosyltransferase family A protein [Rheinheimera baltica]|uniref:Glycosyltransferase family A protein n=1 Tax=Rheinheimera baltica TaxID=67576 RepID=A0ABT9HVU0_9GAMM|nr:glycosyltransferase family A protein [Rheinheimera baltica]MDP5134940.1 glycosyltransferase family A protein [Rheinheimera baltica]
MMTLDVLISCCNDSVSNVPQMLLPEQSGVRYIVVHQQFHTSGDALSVLALTNRSDVLYVKSTDKGLARSRNLALSYAEADIVLFTDDDVQFLPTAFVAIKHAFSDMPDADIITFRYCVADGLYRKVYPVKPCKRNLMNIFRVSSVEVAVRRRSTSTLAIKFDERFGLGTANPVSEENIFLADCIHQGLNVWFYPATIVCHPDITSGANWDIQTSSARGALFKRVFGPSGLVILSIFMCKHSAKFGNIAHFFRAFKAALRGFLYFRR